MIALLFFHGILTILDLRTPRTGPHVRSTSIDPNPTQTTGWSLLDMVPRFAYRGFWASEGQDGEHYRPRRGIILANHLNQRFP
jgi:hypothetical protein